MDKKKVQEQIMDILNELPNTITIVFNLCEKNKNNQYVKSSGHSIRYLFTLNDELAKEFITFLQCKKGEKITNGSEIEINCYQYDNETKCNVIAVKYIVKKLRENLKRIDDCYSKHQAFALIKDLEDLIEFMELGEESHVIMTANIKYLHDREKLLKEIKKCGIDKVQEKFSEIFYANV